MLERKIELEINIDLIEDSAVRDLDRAIGRLASWGMERFPEVTIVNDFGKNNLLGLYFTEEGQQGFVMGAVWRESEGEYSFHS